MKAWRHGEMEAGPDQGKPGGMETWRNGDGAEENLEDWRLDVWIFGSLVFPDVLVFRFADFSEH